MEIAVVLVTVLAILAAIGLGMAFYGVYGRLKSISRLSFYLYRNRHQLSRLVKSLEECVKGKEKINQDAVDANIALVNEVTKLRMAVSQFTAAVAPQADSAPEYTPRAVQERYESIYTDLMEQGIDPERAKWISADYELDEIAGRGIDENLGIGS